MNSRFLSLLIASATLFSCNNLPIPSEAAEGVLTAIKPVTLPPTPPRKIIIEKALQFDKYTLGDTIPYRDTVRIVQWDAIKAFLYDLDSVMYEPAKWGILRNVRNSVGEAPVVKNPVRDAYGMIADSFKVARYQGVPVWSAEKPHPEEAPDRYLRDGSLVKILSGDGDSLIRAEHIYTNEKITVPPKYVKVIGSSDSVSFRKVIFVDRKRQYITSLEKSGRKWLVRSINPATTGLHNPPHQQETPLGIFVVQEKKRKMFFLVDGTSEIGGFAPYASRFCNGAYIHGVPVNRPREEEYEYSYSLGTTPRSHMCVRNATSHARFMFEWAPVYRSLVVIIE